MPGSAVTNGNQSLSTGAFAALAYDSGYYSPDGEYHHATTFFPPWTQVAKYNQHANATNSGALELSVRRWTSTYTGHVRLLLHAAKPDTACGDRSTALFYLNGGLQGQIPLAFNDAVGQTQQYFPDIRAGEVLDFALSPAGLGTSGAANDNCDSTIYTVNISPAAAGGVTVTDSRYFSTVQGGGGWYYSYALTKDRTLTDFIANQGNLIYDGANWHHTNAEGTAPWTTIRPVAMHPNASPNEDAVRRWVSTTAGPVTIQWRLAKAGAKWYRPETVTGACCRRPAVLIVETTPM